MVETSRTGTGDATVFRREEPRESSVRPRPIPSRVDDPVGPDRRFRVRAWWGEYSSTEGRPRWNVTVLVGDGSSTGGPRSRRRRRHRPWTIRDRDPGTEGRER